MIFTHYDLDGAVAALCAQYATEHKEVYVFSYEPDRNEKWSEIIKSKPEQNVIFTDISLWVGELEEFRDNHKTEWTWVDHHPSSLEFNTKGIFDHVLLDCSGAKCAADIIAPMAYAKLTNEPKLLSFIESWVERAHDRDLWINEQREMNMKLDFIVKVILKEQGLTPFMRLNPESMIQQYEMIWKRRWDSYIRSCNTANSTKQLYVNNTIRIIIAWITGDASDVADTLYERGNEIIAMLQLFESNVAISLRTKRKDIDLSKVAKGFNGGGHSQSAGGRLAKRHLTGGFDAIVAYLFDLLKRRD